MIDAGSESAKIAAAIRENGLTPKYLLSTHGHADHTGAVATLKEEFSCQFGLGEADSEFSRDQPQWLESMMQDFVSPPAPDLLLSDGEKLALNGGEVQVIATPGHTDGSVCYMVDDIVFTGDTLFKEAIGRFDLPGGNEQQELDSIRDRLMVLGDSLEVKPGHGPDSTIGHERASNPYIQL